MRPEEPPMKALRMFALAAALIGSMTLAACTSGGGCCGKDGCGCSVDRNCCDGCRTGTGCTCK